MIFYFLFRFNSKASFKHKMNMEPELLTIAGQILLNSLIDENALTLVSPPLTTRNDVTQDGPRQETEPPQTSLAESNQIIENRLIM